jgi:hypothetical protein
MVKRKWLIGFASILFFPFTAGRFPQIFAQDNALAVDELIAAHLKSIGSPEALERVHSRVVSGLASVRFIQGYAASPDNGAFIIASEQRRVGIRMKFGLLEYPGEYFAYDGKNVTVAHINPGERSPLGRFVFRFDGILKEGLMGGVLSVAWPLLDIKERHAELIYEKGKLEGRPVHVLDYRPKNNFGVRIRLFFDWNTHHHVRSEYHVRQRAYAPWETSDEDIMSSPPDSIYALVEKFDNFKPTGGLMLPRSYTIEYSAEGRGPSFVANWIMGVEQITDNGQIESDFFVAEK